MRTRPVVAAITAVVVLAAVGLLAFWYAFNEHLPLALRPPPAPGCTIDPGTTKSTKSPSASTENDPMAVSRVDISNEQMANASTISAVGLRRGVPAQAIVVALATAWQESKMENLDGGDRDSVGLFQQRPSQGWGNRDQLLDQRYAANAFYAALVKVPGWQKMRVTDAAQAVQRSADSEAYQQWAARSQLMAGALTGEVPAALGCVVAEPDGPRATASRSAVAAKLTAELKLDWGTVSTATVNGGPATIAVNVGNAKAGWQYAHWLVSNAERLAVRGVSFSGMQWHDQATDWQTAATTSATATKGGPASHGTGGTGGGSGDAGGTGGAGGSATGQVLVELY